MAANADPGGATVDAGGRLIGPGRVVNVEVSGLMSGVDLVVGGEIRVFSGGVVRGDTIRGDELVQDGGYGFGELIAGGQQTLQGGATTSGEIIGAGAIVDIQGGVASGSIVLSGGREFDGGTVRGGVVSAGGFVQDNGVAIQGHGACSAASRC